MTSSSFQSTQNLNNGFLWLTNPFDSTNSWLDETSKFIPLYTSTPMKEEPNEEEMGESSMPWYNAFAESQICAQLPLEMSMDAESTSIDDDLMMDVDEKSNDVGVQVNMEWTSTCNVGVQVNQPTTREIGIQVSHKQM